MEVTREFAVVAEEQDFCRAGLASMLKRHLGFSALLEAREATDFFAKLAQSPAVTLATLDLRLPGLDGAAGIRKLRDRFPAVRVVIVTDLTDRSSILASLAAGVHGYIPKSYPAAEMLAALRFVTKGHIYVPAILAEAADVSVQAPTPPPQPDPGLAHCLTARQREVVALVSQGYSNKEIARALQIAPGTVKVHVNGAFRAMGVHNRVNAAAAYKIPSLPIPKAGTTVLSLT